MEKRNDLYFLCYWNKVREKTWSGTCFSLFRALDALFHVIDVPLHTPLLIRVLRKIRLLPRNTPSQAEIRYFRLFHSRRIPYGKKQKSKSRIFQFTDMLPDNARRETYVYQDLSINYVRHLAEAHPKRFRISNFESTPPQELKRRAKAELEYYSSCKIIFTMGQWLAHYLAEDLGVNREKIYPVGGGININKQLINDGNERKGNKILFIGRDFLRKGGYLTYEAFRILRKKRPDCELYVAGPANDPIESACPGYHFVGECSPNELSRLFNSCDIFCMPSYFEAYGLVFIEALSFGLPCIGRNRYEMPYFIEEGKNGYLIEDDNAELLAEKMGNLLCNTAIQERVKSMREYYLKQYSWENVATKIKDAIDKEENASL